MKKFDKNDFVIDDVFKYLDKKYGRKSDSKKVENISEKEETEEYYVINV